MALKSRVHQHAAGALMGELVPDSELSKIDQVQHREALGRSKGGFSTKHSSSRLMAMAYL